MLRLLILLCCCCLTACSLVPKDETLLPTAPLSDEAPPPPMPALTIADLLPPPTPPVTCVLSVQVPALSEEVLTTPTGNKPAAATAQIRPVSTKPPKTLSPTEVVQRAQQDALVQPTPATYFGKTTDARYTWQPGQIYTVLLAPTQTTVITLPPKEVLLIGLALRDDEFLVVNKKVGREDQAHFVVTITPQDAAKGEYQVALITESGHQFRLKLVVGQVGMTGVTFETPTVQEVEK
jgi:hypothetical protein